MPTPDWREGDLLTALLDERAGLRDPMKVAAALDELQAGTRGAPGVLHERVHALLQPAETTAPGRRRLRLGRPRLLPAVGLAGAAAVLLLGVILAAGTGGSQTVTSLGGKDDVATPSAASPPR